MFIYHRTVRFQDTDAAGVMYFANGLAIAHEAYEASLQATGIDQKAFFKGVPVAVPIVHASVDFLRPIAVGDRLEIHLTPFSNECTTPTNSVSPLNPPILGDFDSCSPQNWGARGAKTGVTPDQTRLTEFEVEYQIYLESAIDKPVIKALTRHVCIDAQTRTRQELPHLLLTWLNQWASAAAVLAD